MSSAASDLAEYARVLREIQDEFPRFDIIRKSESGWMKAADIALKIITLWRMKTFMTSFITTMGDDIFVPDSWFDVDKDPITKAITLRHERVHFRQQLKMGRWKFTFRYFWFPTVWAKGRRDIEQEAYAETLRAWVDYRGLGVLKDDGLKEHIVNQFLSPNYFWTWPWREDIENWYDAVATDIHMELTSN